MGNRAGVEKGVSGTTEGQDFSFSCYIEAGARRAPVSKQPRWGAQNSDQSSGQIRSRALPGTVITDNARRRDT